MKIVDEPLPGLKLIEPKYASDQRGAFVKTFNRELYDKEGIDLRINEEFFSTSRAGVIRGMHFQVPPADHDKLVYAVTGRVLDVWLDLRRGSGTYGRAAAVELSAENRLIAFIPRGVAHGFLALSDGATLIYKTSAGYVPSLDRGIRWDSFGFDWGVPSPLISERDRSFESFERFETPF